MPCISNDDFHQKSFKITPHDNKFFSKLLSRESSKSSFRVYYGDVSSAVPFHWETTPGTPKHNSAASSQIPPLTPPPSYYAAALDKSARTSSRSKLLLHNLLRRMNPGSKRVISHSPSSSLSSDLSWSSSSHSSYSDPLSRPDYIRKRRRFSSWRSSFDAADSPRRYFGGNSALVVRKALLSIVGRGSGAGGKDSSPCN